MSKIAIIRIRSAIRAHPDVLHTLDLLKLKHSNHCVIFEKNPALLGMVNRVKDYTTWGDLDEATLKLLVEKRGVLWEGRETDSKKKYKYTCFEFNGKKYLPVFKLNPPTKGYGRKGVKTSFTNSGALGDRKEKINNLIQRMI